MMEILLILIVLGFITILNIGYTFQYGKKLKVCSENNLKDITFGKHGVVTLYNSLQNLIVYNSIVLIIGIYIISALKFEFSHSSTIVGLLIFLFFIVSLFWLASSTYRFSEIKHLVDGISTNDQSHQFFSRTFFSGIFNMLAVTILLILFLILLGINLIFFILFLSFIIIMFLAGMADVLQSKTIDNYGKAFDIKKMIKEQLNIMYNFYRLFKENEYRMKSKKTL